MAWTRQRITYTSGVAFVVANLVVGALLVSSGGGPGGQAAGPPPPPPPPRHPPGPPGRVTLPGGPRGGHSRKGTGADPYTLSASPRAFLAPAASAGRPRDIGFRFGPPPRGGGARRSVSVSYPSSSFTFTWSA